MLTRNNLLAIAPIQREMIITWNFNAPPELIFKAYIDPNLIPQWWGSKILATTVVKMDVRPGGIWRFVQRDSDGNEYISMACIMRLCLPSGLHTPLSLKECQDM